MRITFKMFREARNEVIKAKEMLCTCAGLTLQYHGGCQCKRKKALKEAEDKLWNLLKALGDE